jgi:hypothetical protein
MRAEGRGKRAEGRRQKLEGRRKENMTRIEGKNIRKAEGQLLGRQKVSCWIGRSCVWMFVGRKS